MAVKIIATLLILTVSLEISSGSAIPIWEFLTRNEKMSYLYSTFAKLVSDHCKTNPDIRSTPVNHCKRDLLNYGYEKLQTFPDLQLDTLDPYQRGANDLIWATIMRGHPALTIAPVRRPQSNLSPPSIVVLSHANSNNKTPTYQKNPIFDEPEHKHTYAMDMDIAYGYAPPPSSAEFVYPVQQSQSAKQPTYLSGPFVFRVRPDGTPIDEDKNKPYPHDDDLEAFQISKQHKVATISSNKQRRLANLTAQHLSVQSVPAQQQQQQQQQQQLQQRSRRQSKVVNKSYTMVSNPFYSRRLVQV